jgi:hypothetical protein
MLVQAREQRCHRAKPSGTGVRCERFANDGRLPFALRLSVRARGPGKQVAEAAGAEEEMLKVGA